MPHMDGVSATQLIREVHPDVPVVAMTSNIRPEDISHYFNWSQYPKTTGAVTNWLTYKQA